MTASLVVGLALAVVFLVAVAIVCVTVEVFSPVPQVVATDRRPGSEDQFGSWPSIRVPEAAPSAVSVVSWPEQDIDSDPERTAPGLIPIPADLAD